MPYKFKVVLNDFWYLRGRKFASAILGWTAWMLWHAGAKSRARNYCCASTRYGYNPFSIGLLKTILNQYPFTTADTSQGVELKEAARRSIVVKWPVFDENEDLLDKGVIIITFTRTFSYFLRNINLEKMATHFHFVLEPSWSGYADPDILAFIGRVRGVIVEASELEDRVFLDCFTETFVPVTFGASDWVDTSRFVNHNLEKTIDSIYVANTNPLKRVTRYLQAVANLVKAGCTNYKACLVCASWGGQKELVRQLVKTYQLEGNLELKFDLTREEVIEHLNRSKTNVLLSYKEGSNRSLFEAMFCNTPVICINENVGVNKSYINEFTGMLVPDSELESALIWMEANFSSFSASNWAVQNISPKVTTTKLAELLSSLDRNFDDKKLLIKTNNPEVSYLEFSTVDVGILNLELLEIYMPNYTGVVAEKIKGIAASFASRPVDGAAN